MIINPRIGEGSIFIDSLFLRKINRHPRFLVINNLSDRFHGAIPKILLVDVDRFVTFKWSSVILKTIIQKGLPTSGYKIQGGPIFDIKEGAILGFLNLIDMLFCKPFGKRGIERKSEDFLNGLAESR